MAKYLLIDTYWSGVSYGIDEGCALLGIYSSREEAEYYGEMRVMTHDGKLARKDTNEEGDIVTSFENEEDVEVFPDTYDHLIGAYRIKASKWRDFNVHTIHIMEYEHGEMVLSESRYEE